MKRRRRKTMMRQSRSAPSSESQRTSDETNRDRAGAPHRGRRNRIGFITLALAAATLAWVLRGLPLRSIHRTESAIRSWRFDDAERELQNYPSWGTNPGRIYFLQARMDRFQARYARAAENLRTAKEAGFDPKSIAREQTLMDIQNGGITTRQLDRLEGFLRDAPDDRPAIYETYAVALFLGDAPAKGMELLSRWRAEYPNDGRPSYWMGWMLEAQGNQTAAMEKYAESLRKNPTLVDPYMAQGKIWSNLSRHDHAETIYRLAHEVAPERIDIQISLAKALWKQRRTRDAIALLEPIARRTPSIYVAGRMVAQHYYRDQDYAKAISILQPMMQDFPEDANLNYLLASSLSELGRDAEAAVAMKKFLTASEHVDQLRSSRFDVPLEEQYQEAIRRALVYRKYDWEQTIQWLNLAAQSQPDNPEPHRLLARHYRESGSIRDATRQDNTAETLAARR